MYPNILKMALFKDNIEISIDDIFVACSHLHNRIRVKLGVTALGNLM